VARFFLFNYLTLGYRAAQNRRLLIFDQPEFLRKDGHATYGLSAATAIAPAHGARGMSPRAGRSSDRTPVRKLAGVFCFFRGPGVKEIPYASERQAKPTLLKNMGGQ
jgi:hypothetical protein